MLANKWASPNNHLAAQISSPFSGVVTLVADDTAVRQISFHDGLFNQAGYQWVEAADHPVLEEATQKLEAFFAGDSDDLGFGWSFAGQGTDFQKQVWQVIADIPYGQVMSYKEIAETVGRPRAYRAVANACGQNPLPIVVPCHRVVGSGARGHYTLGGYSSGLDKKKWLMEREGITL